MKNLWYKELQIPQKLRKELFGINEIWTQGPWAYEACTLPTCCNCHDFVYFVNMLLVPMHCAGLMINNNDKWGAQ